MIFYPKIKIIFYIKNKRKEISLQFDTSKNLKVSLKFLNFNI